MPPGLGYINPAIIQQAMQQRGFMPKGPPAAQLPPWIQPTGPRGPQMIAPQDVTSGLAPRPQVQIQQAPGGIAGFLNKPGIRDAMMQMGSALLAQKDQPGSFGGALGRAIPVGMQAYQQGQSSAAIDELFKDAPPQMQALLRSLNGPQKLQFALQQMQPGEGFTLSPGEVRYGPDGRPLAAAPDTPAAPSATMQELQAWMDAHPEMSPAEAQASFYAAKRAPGTTVTTNVGPAETAAQRAIGEQVANTVGEESSRIRSSQPVLTSLDRAIEIADSEAFESVTGPTRTVGEIFSRFSADPTTRQLMQEFDLITGAITLDRLNAFTGQKSEKELEMATKLASGDRSMNADGLQAGLNYIKRVMEAEQVDWAERLLAIDPDLYGIDPRMIQQQRTQARQILQRYRPYSGQPDDAGGFSDLVPGG